MKIQKNINVPQDRLLFVGTNEQIAKSAPNKGLPPLSVLTDVYTGFFCKQSSKNDEKWGIISVNLNELRQDMLAPYIGYLDKFTKNKDLSLLERHQKLLANISKYKSKWNKSLEEAGACMYLAQIPSSAIKKVMIYTPSGRDGNIVVNDCVTNSPSPASNPPSYHKANYKKHLGISRWLNGEDVKCEDVFEEKVNFDLENLLANRYGLDIYYMKPVEKGKKHAAAKKS